MLILEDDEYRAPTDDVDALDDNAIDANDTGEAALSDNDVDVMEAESITEKKSRKNKEGTKAKGNQISIELGYNQWMQDNIWLTGK